MTTSLFPAMGLAEPLLQALTALGFNEPTPVQTQIIPKAVEGGDWMVSSQTGSGKTLAFLLPLLHRMLSGDESRLKSVAGPTALVLCPTRELAQQVAADAISVLKHQRAIRVATVLGGVPFNKQIADLRGAQLIVATPGRLLDLVNQRKISLNHVETLVLDEADRMLDLGFSEDLEAIHALCAQRTQTLMFSATFMPRIMGLAENIMNAPQRLELTQSHETNENIAQHLCWASNNSQKRKLLNHWLGQPEMVQAIVFTSTQMDTETLSRALNDDGIMAAPLHGAMPQALRNRRIKSLREGKLKVLVATDVAARGIDVPAISHVINFGLPMKAEDYVHRIGRTGRAGRNGIAVTLAEPADRRKVAAIERYIRLRLPVANIEGFDPVNLNAEQRGGRSGFGNGRPRSEGAPRRFENRHPEGGSSFRDGETREFKPRGEGGFNSERREGNFNSDRRPSNPSSFGDRKEGGFGARREGGFNSDRREGGFNSDRRPSSPSSFGDRKEGGFGARREGGFNSDRRPSSPSSFGDRREGGFNSDRRPSGPSSFGERKEGGFGARREGGFNSDRRPSGNSSFGDRKEGGFNSDRRPSGPSSFGDRKPTTWAAKPAGDRPRFGRPSDWSTEGNTQRKPKFSES
jgi:superfamily II DNA/RNA helicase